MRYLTMALLCLMPVLGAEAPKNFLDKPTMEAYLRHLLPFSPQVQIQVQDPAPSPVAGLKKVKVKYTYGQFSEESTFYVSSDGKHMLQGDLFEAGASPFQAQLNKLNTKDAPSFGAAAAPVTIVMFSDFQCPLCKDEAKSLRTNLPKEFPTQVKVYFKDFPLVQIHPWAKAAAITGRCIYHANAKAFWDYYDWIYDNQGDLNADNLKAKTSEFLASHKLDSMQLGQCIDSKATEKEVDQSIAEGRSIPGLMESGQRMDGVDSTPTLYVNGLPIVGNIPWNNLKALIDKELAYQQAQAAESEKCCEVKIPSALNK